MCCVFDVSCLIRHVLNTFEDSWAIMSTLNITSATPSKAAANQGGRAPFSRLYLASASPRRKALLQQVGVDCLPYPVDIDETPLPNEGPEAYVLRLARSKASTAWERLAAVSEPLYPVLGSDTCGVLNGDILGKPTDKESGIAMLKAMSGTTHTVLTAVAVRYQDRLEHQMSATQVRFATLSVEQIERYWATGEPLDKAGAYGIQGLGAVLVEHIEGSYSGVVGLPLAQTVALLDAFGVTYWNNNQHS